MKINSKLCRTGVLLLLMLFFLPYIRTNGANLNTATEDLSTDTFNILNESFLLPQAHAKSKYTSAIYLFNIVIPKAWTLDNIKAPMFSYAGKYSLPHGFNIQASIATLIISTRINAGPFWHYSVNNCHFGLGYQVAFNYGRLRHFGFYSTLTGWEQQPSATFGYSFKTMAVTLRGDLYWTSALYASEGGNVIPYTDPFINGYSITTSLEQRLWKNRVMSIGFKWSYLRYHIVAWPAFPVNKNKYLVPELQIGLNF
jgi:hypothetical protein